MLGEREGTQGTVKCPPGQRHLALVHQELTVVNPDTRHLGGWRASIRIGGLE